MNWNVFFPKVAEFPVFDLPLAHQLCGGKKPGLLVQLNRWTQSGKLTALRRGLYLLGEPYRKKEIPLPALANAIYHPSYVSGLWALGFFGLIPEKVSRFTSVSTRVTRRFENDMGTFAYSHVQQPLFFGFSRKEILGASVRIADPEKALLDHWHLHPGEWSPARMEEMRFQNRENVDPKKLEAYGRRFSPRVRRAVATWKSATDPEEEGRLL